MYRAIGVIFFINLFVASVSAQGTINLMSGKKIDGSNITVSKGFVHYDYKKKNDENKHPKVSEEFDGHEASHGQIEIYRVFSITDSLNNESIIYAQDSLHGRHYSVDEMRIFIEGEQEADKVFKAPMATVATGLIGVANGLVFSFNPIFALPGAFLTAFVSAAIPAKVKATSENRKKLIQEYSYRDGYKRVAKSKKLRNSMVGSAVGTTIGLVSGILFL